MTSTRARWLALAFTGWVGFAHALALGEIQVTSHLNQTLAATIPVTTSKAGELDGATVEIASNEEFERAGMERPEFLSALRFEVRDNVIKVTSKQIAREPFVSFLLDVRYAGGHLLREYTVLLDPPNMGRAPPRPKAVVVQPATPAPAPEAAPTEAAPSAEAPASGEAPAPAAESTAPAAEAPASEAAPAPAEAATTTGQSGGTYGPVGPQETLWGIAYKLRPDTSLTMDQMQIAIFNLNPQAFDHGRLTGLMKGATLRVPTVEDIRAVDPVAAKAEVARARNGGSAPAPTPKPARHAKAAPAPQPSAEPAPAPAESTPAPKAEEPPPAPAPEPTPPPAPAPQAAAPEAAPASTPPPSSSPPPPSSAVAQAPPEAAPAPAEAAPAKVEPAPEPAKPAPTAEPQAAKPAPAPAKAEPSFLTDLLDRGKGLVSNPLFIPAAAGFVVLLALLIGFNKIRDKYAKWSYERASRKAMAPKPSVAPSADADVTAVAPMMTAEEHAASEAATMMTPPPTAESASTATQALGAQTMQSTLQQTFQSTQIQEPPAATTGGQKVDFDVTGNFANETVQINLDAGDPVSEAEFHRAYGLYDEAALLLKQALQKDPKRTDARVKLAEIYFEASKANEFVEVAKELKGKVPEEEWQKIALLGTQIAPGNEMFAGGGVAAGDVVDLSFGEPSAPAAAAAPAAPAAPPAESGGLDFKLEDVQLDAPAAAPAAAPAPAAGGMEFDLGSLSLDAPAQPAPAAEAAAEPAASAPPAGGELNLSDFDVGGDASAPASGGEMVDMGAEVAPAGDESSTKLDLARAYIDMGDNDMAKSLLNEVVQQGNPQQKSEAQELLKRVPA